MTREPDRREALRLCALAAASLVAPRGGASLPGAPRDSDEDALDAALLRLQGEEPISRQGLSTHAPMAVEALCAMGMGAQIEAWLSAYDRRRLELPRATRPIDEARWREALGLHPGAGTWEQQNPRYGDWVVHFERQLEERAWPDVLDSWVSRLAPGLASAATHGVIRTAHAARALHRRSSNARRRELARGLAYWASSFQDLPAPAVRTTRHSDLPAALAALPLYADRHGATPRGSFVAGLTATVQEPGLLAAIDLAAPESPSAAWSAFAALGAQALIRHGLRHDPLAFVHAITGPLALRRLAPHVKPETLTAALPHAWRTAALLYAGYARRDDPVPVDLGAAPPSPAALAERAAEHGDEHLLKLTDAALEHHAASPAPSLLVATAALRAVL